MLNFNRLGANWRIFINNQAKKEVTLFSKSNFSFSFKPFLLMQGAVVFAIILLFVFISVNLFFPKPQVAESQIIKSAIVKKTSNVIANGQPVKWSVIVKKSDINKNQKFIKLPKSAENIKVKTISIKQAETILAQTAVEPKLTMADRQQLAMASRPKNFFAKISNFLFADLEQAVGDAVQQITEQTNPDITQTSDATVVDLSKQELKDQEKEVAKENKKEESAPAVEEPVPATSDNSQPPNPNDQNVTMETAPIENPAPAETSAPIETPTPLETLSPSDQPVVEMPQESLLETVSPSDQQAVQNPNDQIPNPNETLSTNDQTVSTPIDEYVQVDYETPAPIITEQETETGKLVTVSDSSQDPNQPQLTDVVAYTTIPEIYKVGQESKIQLKWKNNGDQNMSFHAYDLNGNGKLDYVEWTVPHLSDQIFEIIFISKAWQLDQDKNIIADIYDTVKTKDNQWATIENNQYVRVTFQQILDNTKDITIYAKPTNQGQTATIGAYTENGTDVIATFENIDHEATYKILLTNLQTPTDVFDLKVIGNVDIDYIVDPSPVTDSFDDSTKVAGLVDVTVSGGQAKLTVTAWACGDTLTDSRDSKTYSTVLIGTQCWMAVNLNVGTLTAGANSQGTDCPSAGEIEKYCYSDSEGNCTTYGGLYQWAQTMCSSASCNGTGEGSEACTTPVQGICPTGWHIPSHYEWVQLELAVCDSASCVTDFPYDTSTTGWRGTNEGTKLKSGGSSGFGGLLAGYRSTNGSFYSLSSFGYFWSSLESGSNAWDRSLNSGNATVLRDTSGKAYGFSVRCVKD